VLNVEEELRILNEKATAAYGAYQEQLQTKASLEGENNAMEKEISDLRAKLMEEQVTMIMFGLNWKLYLN
jgi:hypothetical protein